MGTGLGRKGAEVRWGVAGRMAVAWLITLPSAAIVGRSVLGTGQHRRRPARVLVVFAVLIALAGWMYLRSRKEPIDPRQRQRRVGRRPGACRGPRSGRPRHHRRQSLKEGIDMDILKNTVDSLWQVVLVGLLLGAGLPAIFAIGLKSLDAGQRGSGGGSTAVAARSPLAVAGAVVCFAVVLIAIVTGILFIMQGFLSHTFGIEIF